MHLDMPVQGEVMSSQHSDPIYSMRSHSQNAGAISKPAQPSIQQIAGISEIEWASAWIPVLAVEQGIDLQANLTAAMRSRIIKRTDLAARFHVDADKPLAAQLVSKGRLSVAQAKLADGGLFENRVLDLQVRIDSLAEHVPRMLADLQTSGLIEIVNSKQHDGYLFVELKTRRFIELANVLEKEMPGLSVLLSLNGSVLYT